MNDNRPKSTYEEFRDQSPVHEALLLAESKILSLREQLEVIRDERNRLLSDHYELLKWKQRHDRDWAIQTQQGRKCECRWCSKTLSPLAMLQEAGGAE